MGCKLTDKARARQEDVEQYGAPPIDTASLCPGDCKKHCDKCDLDYMCPSWYDDEPQSETGKILKEIQTMCQAVIEGMALGVNIDPSSYRKNIIETANKLNS